MTLKKLGRAGCHQATPYLYINNRNNITNRSRVKALVVRLAMHQVIPAAVASWLIHVGGLRHD